MHRVKFLNNAEVGSAVVGCVQFRNFERINLTDGLISFKKQSWAA